MIAYVTPITKRSIANSGRGTMNARRSIRGRWCSMAIFVASAAVMLAATITVAQADVPTISNLNDTAIAELTAALREL